MGAHQKIDRVARRHLKPLLGSKVDFPTATEIIHFEGRNGPDGIKSKSPGRDEPWHYIDPKKPDDTTLLALIADHSHNLTEALMSHNRTRAAFEAAWLAHALVDGLTPAHHYPLGDKIEELWGKPHHERSSFRDKNIIRGDTKRDSLKKNWQYWGAKGIFTTHFMYEFGFATSISGLRFTDVKPSKAALAQVLNEGIGPVFLDAVQTVDQLKMYETYYKRGWTHKLAQQSREILAPLIINVVTLAWYEATNKAEKL